MSGQYNLRNPGVKRLMKEAQELREPTEQFYAQPLEDNLFEWHFTIRGPIDSEFDGGIYHGRIILPPEYPMKPPSIILLTPNGRFETNTKICLSISGYHPESWQPSWSIRTALLAIIGFMPTHGSGAIGSLDYTADERKAFARKSLEWKCTNCGSVRNILLPVTDASKATSVEAKELAAQISFQDEKEKDKALAALTASSSPLLSSSDVPSTNAPESTPVLQSGTPNLEQVNGIQQPLSSPQLPQSSPSFPIFGAFRFPASPPQGEVAQLPFPGYPTFSGMPNFPVGGVPQFWAQMPPAMMQQMRNFRPEMFGLRFPATVAATQAPVWPPPFMFGGPFSAAMRQSFVQSQAPHFSLSTTMVGAKSNVPIMTPAVTTNSSSATSETRFSIPSETCSRIPSETSSGSSSTSAVKTTTDVPEVKKESSPEHRNAASPDNSITEETAPKTMDDIAVQATSASQNADIPTITMPAPTAGTENSGIGTTVRRRQQEVSSSAQRHTVTFREQSAEIPNAVGRHGGGTAGTGGTASMVLIVLICFALVALVVRRLLMMGVLPGWGYDK